MERFVCLGTPVQADEGRSAAVCQSSSGMQRVVLAARGYVLIVDADSGKCTQVAFPEGLHDYPFASMCSRSGLYYTGAGHMLMVLDPFHERFVAWEKPAPEEEIVGFAFAEDAEGHVYLTTYPSCKLLRIDAASGKASVVARLDMDQKYAMTLAVDSDGWVYAGIGTTEAGIAAYCLADGKLLTLKGSGPSVRGSGHVHMGKDGQVYASLPAFSTEKSSPALEWYRLDGGKAISVEETDVSASYYKGTGYRKLHQDLSGGRKVVKYELAEGELVIQEPDGRQTEFPLSYQGNGTALSPMIGGPDGRLYGTSNHPLHLYRYDPDTEELLNFGGKVVEQGGGGNICAYTSLGPYIIGAAYAGGHLHILDTRKPLQHGTYPARNPRLVYSDERIHRPRCAFAHPDGNHVLVGGFPGYGAVGGSLIVLDVDAETTSVYEHDVVVPNQSTLSLGVLSCGNVIGSTSIETPGGGAPAAREAVLYRFDWQHRRVTKQWSPIPDAREISLLVVDAQNRVHAITSDSIYFVFDPVRESLIYCEDVSEWGAIVRNGLLLVNDASGSQVVVGLLSRGLFMVQPDVMKPRLVTELPKEATSGLALLQGKIYYGCGSELWSYEWTEGAGE